MRISFLHGDDVNSTVFSLPLLQAYNYVGFFRLFKFTLKPPYSIAHDKLRLAIWDTSFWNFLVKFGHKGP